MAFTKGFTSIIPILFIPFNNNECECNHCGKIYSETIRTKQKYCKDCFFTYIKNTDYKCTYCGNKHPETPKQRYCFLFETEAYLDARITCSVECNKRHDYPCYNFINICGWCEYCSDVLDFNQVATESGYNNRLVPYEYHPYRYRISSGWIKSASTKNPIPILYLPWWDARDKCIACNSQLEFTSDCQKWCSHCLTIYTGCRYCLTTNIIFGITDKSSCKNCKRITFISINIANFSYGNSDIDEFLFDTRTNINNYMNKNNVNRLMIPFDVYNFFNDILSNNNIRSKPEIEWIPFSQITNLIKLAEGGFGIIYKATLFDKTVAIKRFFNSQNISKYFLNELKSLHQCYNTTFIVKYYGITQDSETKEYMIIMEYANGGNLHNYLQKNFRKITWNSKLYILWKISEGLNIIHKKNFLHRDFHSGNILLSSYQAWLIGDLGLSQPANNILLNNEIYGVIPYVAPEIFRGAAFSKESDIYSTGMIMWELTTGCKPFANVEHDANLIYEIIDGKQPEITNDTPECLANLMRRCWNSDPLKRPSITEINEIVCDWYFGKNCVNEFDQAERKRLELIQSMKLGPEFSKKPHSKAIYTSRALSSFISESSSVSPSSIISFNTRQEYHSKECDLDIDIDIDNQRTSSSNINSTVQNSLNTQHPNAIYTSRPLSNLISTVRKRNTEELNIEIQNNRKHIKTNNSLNSESQD